MNTRLTSSHSNRPPATDNVPAIFLWRTPSSMSVADLRHARQEQAIDREILRDVADRFESIDTLGQLRFRHRSGRLEICAFDEKVVGLLDFGLLDLAHLHQ